LNRINLIYPTGCQVIFLPSPIHPAFPTPLFRGEGICAQLGRIAPEIAKPRLDLMSLREAKRQSSVPAKLRDRRRSAVATDRACDSKAANCE
jgi:hypothetical protein